MLLPKACNTETAQLLPMHKTKRCWQQLAALRRMCWTGHSTYRASCNDVTHVSMRETLCDCLQSLCSNLSSLQTKALGAETHLQDSTRW